MKVLVTGAAGFIGSHTVSALAEAGVSVVGLDCLVPYYSPAIKRARLAGLEELDGFEFLDLDLRDADLAPVMAGVDVVVHLAAQPGVRTSWSGFESYVQHNVLATQRLLEAAKGRVGRVVYASSSSVYGDALGAETDEHDRLAPRSPYGVTKLSGEQLCQVYSANFDLPAVALRYFTVFGPGQRPDMAMHRLIEAAETGRPFPLYGDGQQVRDFTFVGDVVAANVAAVVSDVAPGPVYNVAGGTSARLLDVIETVESLTGRTVTIDRRPASAGDVARTSGRTERIRGDLGWQPRTGLVDGLAAQIDWQRTHRALLVA